MTNITVIIPVLNEGNRVASVIQSTRQSGDCEIIVVDGGSTDDTVTQAATADHVLQTQPGRALQQNTGAAKATGQVLLFLHADCQLPPGAIERMTTATGQPGVVGGCFRQHIDAPGRKFRWLEAGNALRVRWLNWAYGDQGIFVRRDVFEDLGGFPNLKLMEDLFLMKLLKRRGQVVLLEQQLTVSARRWQRKGVLRETCRNWFWIALVQLGVSPNRLAKYYPHVR